MEEPRLKALAEQHNFEAWQNRRTLDDDLFVWNLTFRGDEFPGWQAELVQAVPVAPASPPARRGPFPLTAPGIAAPSAAAEPQLLFSTWSRKDSPGAVMTIAIYQSASAAEARERCLQLLGEFELLQLGRDDGLAMGDVAFSNPEKHVILFVRGNLVILMRNGGKQLVPLDDAARELDNALTARPVDRGMDEAAPAGTEAQPPLVPAKGRALGKPMPLRLPQPHGLTRARIFSSGGEVSFRDGKLAYTAESEGAKRLEVQFDAENPMAVSQEFTLRQPRSSGSSGRGRAGAAEGRPQEGEAPADKPPGAPQRRRSRRRPVE